SVGESDRAQCGKETTRLVQGRVIVLRVGERDRSQRMRVLEPSVREIEPSVQRREIEPSVGETDRAQCRGERLIPV
ncbi:hypothetical protein chiPu_0025037, partial [Chiloscyllium punctatum]|nr:hypothetical protein [Chiloscyllium punctatum]